MTSPATGDDAFPVEWRSPGDADWLWTQDRLHYPDPVTPLEFALVEEGVDAGLTKAAHAYGLPLTVHDRLVNGYLYTRVESCPTDESPGSSEMLDFAMSTLRATWDASWLPEIRNHLAWWSEAHLQEADAGALLQHLEETEQRWQRLWEIHFLMFLPAKLAISEFVDLYNDLFGSDDAFGAYKMLAGFQTKTVESGQWLWELSRRILAVPELRQLFADVPDQHVVANLRAANSGSDILEELNRYLEVHGRRADKLSLNASFWLDDPAPVVQSLKQYLVQEDRDLIGELVETRRQREEQVADLRAIVRDYPRALREEVLARLRAAQEGAYLSEEHGYWIDYWASYCVRRELLSIGEHLTRRGILDDPGAMFYLQMDEVKQLLASEDPKDLYQANFEKLACQRRETDLQFATVVPPATLGAMAEATVGDEPWGRVAEMFDKVEGRASAVGDKNVILGTAGSPGVVEGRAIVVHVLGEGGRLEPGDILVADTTTPPWTLLFATAGGLVTNSGGVLSHAAVIAREYRIPAVLGTGDATRRLQDGQRIEVDGTRGIVRILE